MNNSLLSRKSYVDNLFDDLFGFGLRGSAWPDRARDVSVVSWTYPRTKTVDGILTMSFDLPGVRKEDLSVEIDAGRLKISAKRYDIDEKIERSYSIDPSRLDVSTTSAELADGILTIRVSEKEELKPKRLTIAVK